MVSGLTTMPDSNFLTWRTCAACCSGSRLRWMTPMPPACAMAIAICASVTVSMAEAMIGILTADRAGDVGADIDVGGQHLRQAGPDQHVVESEPFARAFIVFCGHRQLRLTRKGQRDRLPKAYKMPFARGSSPGVTARFWVGAGG